MINFTLFGQCYSLKNRRILGTTKAGQRY